MSVLRLLRCLSCSWLSLRTVASHPLTQVKGSQLKQAASNIFNLHTQTHTYKCKHTRTPVTYQTHISHHDTSIYCTQLHCVSLSICLSHTHTQMPSLAASVQFLNGSAVRVRLMVSQPPPSACIFVHHSAQPFSPSSQQRSVELICVQLHTVTKPPTEQHFPWWTSWWPGPKQKFTARQNFDSRMLL